MDSLRRPRVLVLEDEWVIAAQIETALTAAGFEVVGPVGRIDSAMTLLRDNAPAAAVLDINVHGELSFSVARWLARASVPFIFLSGYAAADLPDDMKTRTLLQKPVDAIDLCREVRAALLGA